MAFQHFISSLSWKAVAAALSDKVFLFIFLLVWGLFVGLVIFLSDLKSFPLILAVSVHEGGADAVEFLPTFKPSLSIT